MFTVKIPKKFADICALIRDGQDDGILLKSDQWSFSHIRLSLVF